MGARRPREVVLDTAALIGIERGDEKMLALLEASLKTSIKFLVPPGVLAQAWRNGARQTRLARFLKTAEVEVVPLTEARARAAGVLCGISRRADVIDASVVISAREHQCAVITGDPTDLDALDPLLQIHRI
ncbi:MAG TPA: PIN domain-containing protein [Myxococcales bacterium]|jgi:rRNA-processing protein FCF1|nr:PIN domain-containing protein [Myxococcales bacterium]